jgi:hypothetical protein
MICEYTEDSCCALTTTACASSAVSALPFFSFETVASRD